MMLPLVAMLAGLIVAADTPALLSAPVPASAAEAQAGDWHPIADDALLVLTLAGGGRVVIRLAPDYAPEHVANVRRLALAHWWDGTTVYRVQDNWVAQWGGQPADKADDPVNKPLPANVVRTPAAEYDYTGFRPAQRVSSDAYAAASGISADGWAIAGSGDGATGWLAHCYGTVAVARDASPDTGNGSELFMPLGGSARRLDRNYTVIGRVIEGARFLSGLPRSDAPMGVYADPRERTAIVSVRLASDLPAATRPHYAYRAADNPRFAAMLVARRQPAGMVASGGIDVCDVRLETKRITPPTP